MSVTKPQQSIEIRLPYINYPDEGFKCSDPSMTHQSFLEECNYNNVLAKWQKSGLITHINPATPIYADVTTLVDYQSSLELIRSAQSMFDGLPSSIRDRFDNDPSRLLSFLQDPANRAEAEKLGLVNTLEVVGKPEAPTAKEGLSTTTAVGG